MAQRNERGQFIPGESGNPTGRPKLSTTITHELIGILESDVEIKRTIARKWIDACKEPDIRALQELLDRTEGKVADNLKIQAMIVHVGDDYARIGIEANKQDLVERRARLLDTT